jgi:hypothetical protein
VVPGRPGSGGPAKFRRAAAGLDQGRAWGGAKGPRGPVPGLGRGWERAGVVRRRRSGAGAAAVDVPARWGCAGDLGKVWGLEWVPRKVGESSLGCTANRARSSTAAASNGAGGGSVRGMAGTRRAATVL